MSILIFIFQDDYRVCLSNGVITKDQEMVCPIDFTGKFVEPVQEFKGLYVKVNGPVLLFFLLYILLREFFFFTLDFSVVIKYIYFLNCYEKHCLFKKNWQYVVWNEFKSILLPLNGQHESMIVSPASRHWHHCYNLSKNHFHGNPDFIYINVGKSYQSVSYFF